MTEAASLQTLANGFSFRSHAYLLGVGGVWRKGGRDEGVETGSGDGSEMGTVMEEEGQ